MDSRLADEVEAIADNERCMERVVQADILQSAATAIRSMTEVLTEFRNNLHSAISSASLALLSGDFPERVELKQAIAQTKLALKKIDDALSGPVT